VDRTDHTKADWLLLVSTKLQVDDVDTEGESPLSVAQRYYEHYAELSPRDAVSMYMAHRAGLKGRRTIVAKDLWIDRFVHRLQPGATTSLPPAVSEFAESAYQLAWDLIPEDVADTFTAAQRGQG
jgi:hypothetical protein